MILMCQYHWEEVISHYQKYIEEIRCVRRVSSVAHSHLRLGIAYLKEGDYQLALQNLKEVTDGTIEIQGSNLFFNALGVIEEVYISLSTPEAFVEFCRSFKERHADAVEKLSFRQWYLEAAEPSTEFPHLAFADDFDTETIEQSWNWIDEFGDCAVAQHSMLADERDFRGFRC